MTLRQTQKIKTPITPMLKQYKIIDHTADIGLECRGETIEALFEAAAEGMFSILTDMKDITVKKRHSVELHASSYDDLLILWLQELLYLFSAKHYVYSLFSVRICPAERDDPARAGLKIHGICGGEPVDLSKHKIYTEIKTATYHQLQVKQTSEAWEGRVIFDI